MDRRALANALLWMFAFTLGGCGSNQNVGTQSDTGRSPDAARFDGSWRGHDSVRIDFGRQGSAGAVAVAPAASIVSPTGAQTGDGFVFGEPRQYQVLQQDGHAWEDFSDVAVADVTGDGREDVVALPASNTIYFFRQLPTGKLAAPVIYRYARDSFLHFKDMVVADFNEDDVLDVASPALNEKFNFVGGVNLLLSDRKGNLVLSQALMDEEYSGGSWNAIDYDHDGHQDIVVVQNIPSYPGTGEQCGYSTCPAYKVMFGNGKGGFPRTAVFKTTTSHSFLKLRVVDLDNDGRKDLVFQTAANSATDPSAYGRVQVMYDRGASGFSAMTDLHAGESDSNPGWLTLADFNADGLIDSLVSYGQTGTELRLQRADRTFSPASVVGSYDLIPAFTVAADFDGDGKQDVASTQIRRTDGLYGEAIVGLNLQRAGVLEPWYFGKLGNSITTLATAVAAGDYNGDGCRDLVIAENYNGLLFLDGKNCIHPVPPVPDESNSPLRVR